VKAQQWALPSDHSGISSASLIWVPTLI
jgi:hypothetical protein